MTYCITHNDLDGIGCAILLEKVYPDIKTFPIDYKELDSILPQVLEEARKHDENVYITDINLNEEQAKLCDQARVQHIDHHISNKKISDKYPWSFTDVSHCATFHLWQMLAIYASIDDYGPFVHLVDDYDTWGHGTKPQKQAKDLNMLFTMIGDEAFVARFKMEASIELTATERAIINTGKHLEERYVREAAPYAELLNDGHGNQFFLIAAEQHTNALGTLLLDYGPSVEYVLILDMLHNKASLRSKGKVNVADLAKACGGGGHAKAAGFPLSEAALKAFWRCNDCEFRKRWETRDTDLDN